MARVVYSPDALADIERIFRFLADDPETAQSAVARIRTAVELLEHHPLIGRIVTRALRELVISFGRSGFVALYEIVSTTDAVHVHAIRHQHEAGYQ